LRYKSLNQNLKLIVIVYKERIYGLAGLLPWSELYKQVNSMKNSILYWFPRILSILYILFISLFALDAFYGANSIGYEILAFLKHLIPAILLTLLLAVAWKREFIGGFLFLVTGVIFTIGYATFRTAPVFFCISCPLFLIGIAFLMNFVLHSRSSI